VADTHVEMCIQVLRQTSNDDLDTMEIIGALLANIAHSLAAIADSLDPPQHFPAEVPF
jgi:hypothetical protein